MKRVVDIAGAAIVLFLTSPVVMVAALAIWLEDRHSPLFRQTRVGANGTPIEIIKLRSMSPGTAQTSSVDADDKTVTRVGAIIRRLSIDELPQLLSVLKGDMSLVGPRPALPNQSDLIALREQNGSSKLTPGLTGLAQIKAYDGMPPSEKAKLDGTYADNQSLFTDLKILTSTAAYLFKEPPKY